MPPQFQQNKPIYLQVMDQLIQEIVSRQRKPGEKLPSVRELAIATSVNPNTIQRVYRELEQRHITETKRGQGTFVTEDRALITTIREELKQQYVNDFVHDMEALGFSKQEIIASIQEGETK
ncbi:GntR family transcriptional regulator [Gracilibacillus alcaliphilus]|uniref:GntR family transcriptional regulator n=1 Tax=Gracilibacillus alcaliphilus TaxID=1401441 RepID=UPI00195AA0AA|nr:GntR family transcriptional regulator [Gracilibacillus alcaliphilus]MBM7675844.1 GntR family transcriptional regulator [Gracilibacillus alcaliphilus]